LVPRLSSTLFDTTWTVNNYTFETLELADSINPGGGNAINPDLRPYAARNGKVIHYMGWAENLISAGNSVHYYETVHSFMQGNSNVNMDSFYRLFTVPGMFHCTGGPGAGVFGSVGQAAPASLDADHNILAGLVKWVEEGTAPETFTAVHYRNDDPVQGVQFSRPLCKYPASLVYKGGNSDQASSFQCI